MTRLKILGRTTSINVRKVMWTADLIGIDYEQEVWGLPHRDPKVPEFLALNPNGSVPVIVDDGFVLWESNAIMCYLAETRASDLMPMNGRERALVDQWLSWQASELNPAWTYAVHALLRKNPAFADTRRIAESIAKWGAAMQMLDDQLAQGSGFVVNGRLSLADIALGLSEHRWFSTPFDRPELPAVKAHYDALRGTENGAKYLGEATP